MFSLLFSTLLSVVAYANESKLTKLQLFLVFKMNFERNITVKVKINSVLKLFKIMEYIHR